MSAVSASSTAVGSISDPVRALQHALYRSAKADPGRRFHELHDKVYRRDVMVRAWAAVRANNGAPGIDNITLAEVEEYGCELARYVVLAPVSERRGKPVWRRRWKSSTSKG